MAAAEREILEEIAAEMGGSPSGMTDEELIDYLTKGDHNEDHERTDQRAV